MDLHAHCGRIGRRSLLIGAGVMAGLTAFRPTLLRAAGGNYEAMLLSCMDPRMQEPVRDYLAKRGLTGKYSQFTFAGAAIGVVAPKFSDWHKTFWDNLAASIQLHNLKSVIAIDHRDCGAAKIAYGDKKVATPDLETEIHRAALAEFREESTKRHPKLAVETMLMALDGSVVTL
ncbi:MAG TPA: carbonic anhydrase [Stellaceae bacterium]|nr:carbonic anhydrase [Stellaceae bacterium]